MLISNKKEINQFNADGKRDGLWEDYYFSGQLRWKGNYINGKRNGLRETYNNNKLIESNFYVNI
jgi:antitoxin component YwqK of YwqJK toxin-antitoxin module